MADGKRQMAAMSPKQLMLQFVSMSSSARMAANHRRKLGGLEETSEFGEDHSRYCAVPAFFRKFN
ncbi:MAG: hypothetical protein AAFR35_14370 [Pseudomonadota bacterium]